MWSAVFTLTFLIMWEYGKYQITLEFSTDLQIQCNKIFNKI